METQDEEKREKTEKFNNKLDEAKQDKTKIKKFILQNLKWIIFIASIAIIFYIIQYVFVNEKVYFDNKAYEVVAVFISNPLTIIMKIISIMASPIVLISITIAIFAIFGKKYGMCTTVNLVTIFLFNQLLKNIFDRPRPYGYRLIEETGFSFPSGHSMVSMAFYGLIIYFVWKKVKNKYLKWSLITLLSILILAIGISRIYLGVHYASDVIGGFCFSIAYLTGYTHFLRTILSVKVK